MKTLLAKNADILGTMDKDRREIKNASLYAEDGVIKKVGPASELPQTADTVIDMSGQTFFRALSTATIISTRRSRATSRARKTTTCFRGCAANTGSGRGPRRKPRARA